MIIMGLALVAYGSFPRGEAPADRCRSRSGWARRLHQLDGEQACGFQISFVTIFAGLTVTASQPLLDPLIQVDGEFKQRPAKQVQLVGCEVHRDSRRHATRVPQAPRKRRSRSERAQPMMSG